MKCTKGETIANDDLVIDPGGRQSTDYDRIIDHRFVLVEGVDLDAPSDFIGMALSSLIGMLTKFLKLNGRALHLAC